MMEPVEVMLAAGIGLLAGVLGGLAGIGGSMVMLPGLGLLFGYSGSAKPEQHLYMAAAMVVNVIVAIPATSRHARAGAVRRDLVSAVLPGMTAGIVAGVLVSNVLDGAVLKYVLAVFIAGYCVLNLVRVVRPGGEVDGPERTGRARLAGIGATGGIVGGLLGLGGGVVLVPLLQVLGRVRLREAIATSSAAMVVSAAIGSMLKVATLGGHGQSMVTAGLLALAMAPGAVLGAHAGASLAHRLPLRMVRAIVSVVLLIAAARLVGADAWVLRNVL